MRREAKGASLEVVVRATRLTRTVLMALEEDRFEDLPAPVYVRGFLRIYAQFLEVEPDQVLEAYESQMAQRNRPTEDAASGQEVVPSPRRLPDFMQDGERKVRGLTPASALLLAATAAIALVFLWSVQRKAKVVVASAQPVATSPAVATSPSMANQPTAAVPQPTAAPVPFVRGGETLRGRGRSLPPLPGQSEGLTR